LARLIHLSATNSLRTENPARENERVDGRKKKEDEREIISADPPFFCVQCDAPKLNAARRSIKDLMMKKYVRFDEKRTEFIVSKLFLRETKKECTSAAIINILILATFDIYTERTILLKALTF